ncbi:MAG: glycosyltransferase 87 family protein, partial [Chthoniobacter sp.]|uniref:glycosyltransferase 87 family protein n=1 Tax=Chthoniobacter sp. TaxID=2510640 RepID=UPI0032A60994
KIKPELLVLLIALLAVAAKLYCAATTYGTVDVILYYGFAKNIVHEGVVNTYLHDRIFNHPPLLGNYLGFAYQLAGGTETTPASGQRFAFFHRLPGILADFSVVLLLLWIRRQTGRPPWWAIAVLAASPVSFMISGYHGNYDPLIPLGLTLTVIACMQRRALLAGVLLAVACQVKIIPLLMSPVLFFYWWQQGRDKAWTFMAATVLTLLLCWSAPLLAAPEIFTRQVLVYNSIWGWWGITYLLNISGIDGLAGMVSLKPLSPSQALVTQTLKFLVIAGTLVLAWRRRKAAPAELLATMGLVWGLFFTFAPGFGVQYLAWVSPFLLFYSTRWFLAFTGSASVALFIFYNTISNGIPWQKGFGLERLFGIWGPPLLLPWVVFVAFMIASRWEFGIGAAPVAEESPDAAATAPEQTETPAALSS